MRRSVLVAAIGGIATCTIVGLTGLYSSTAQADAQPGMPSAECTIHVPDQDSLDDVQPGDVVCIDDDLSDQSLDIEKGGTEGKPITYLGPEGQQVGRIGVNTEHVVVDGYTMNQPQAPGVYMEGNHLTLQNVTISDPVDGDGHGIRFFGDHINVLNNKVLGTNNEHGHADCMQTYNTTTPTSSHVLIEGNRCEGIDNMGLIAEGPDGNIAEGPESSSDDNDGSFDWTIKNNYFETTRAAQNLLFEDVQNITISGNEFAGGPTKVISLNNCSTNTKITDDNVYNGDNEYLVGSDECSMEGYEGPEPGGGP